MRLVEGAARPGNEKPNAASAVSVDRLIVCAATGWHSAHPVHQRITGPLEGYW